MEDTVCQTCSDDGNQKEAYGFCQDCGEYLCQDCFQNHCKPRPSRNHTLLDMDQMMKVIPIVRKKETRNVLTKLGGPDEVSEEPTSPDCSIENSSSEPEREETGFLSIRASFLKDVYVRSETDQESLCQITSMVLMSENKLMLTDKEQQKVKLIDINIARVLSELKFVINSQIITPVDVVKVDKKRAVVGLQDGKCMLVNVGVSLTIDRLITSKPQTVLSYYPDDGLHVYIDNNRSEITTVDLYGNETILFKSSNASKRPSFFKQSTVSHAFTGSLIKSYQSKKACFYAVVRDIASESQGGMEFNVRSRKWYVACLTPDGKTTDKKQFQNDVLDIAVDETGRVLFVLSGGVVHVLEVGTTEARGLWTKTEGLCRACALAYCPDSKRLYVGMSDSNNVKVYQLSGMPRI